MASEDAIRHPYPLYSTTFTLHRVSPLYIGTNTPLDNTALLPYARRFRDILAGDVLRGVRVGLAVDEDALARVGALQTVTWKVLVSEDAWDIWAGDATQMDETMEFGPGRGLHINITYEKATYSAILLRSQRREGGADGAGFQWLPLMLTRMPGSLRETFAEFLANTFDARVSVLRMGPSYLPSALESYVANCLLGEDGEVASFGESSGILKRILKDIQVVIGFDLPSSNSSLKTVDMLIARDDLPRFVQRGGKVAGESGEKEGQKTPFMDALALHVQTHLALDMRHEAVKILRVACGAFVLGSEGKAKLTEPTSDEDGIQGRATTLLIDGLIELAEGTGLLKAPR